MEANGQRDLDAIHFQQHDIRGGDAIDNGGTHDVEGKG
jgi:hypothetical protein